jgi:biotin synthase
MCFLAGANSIFVGAKLLTTSNPEKSDDEAFLENLGMRPMSSQEAAVIAAE